MSVRAFYDGLAPWYHLVYEDWETSVARQGAALASIIRERWGAGARLVLDAALGIGPQALGLAAQGFRVVGSDLSPVAVNRARLEASRRGVALPCHVADFQAPAVRSASVDVVLAADNALPHLDTEHDVERALAEWLRCLRPGGGCLISMRDYGAPPAPGTVQIHPYGERLWAGRRYRLRQVWTWQGPRYEVALEIAAADAVVAEPALILTTSYLAITPARVADLMRAVGLANVQRLDGRFFQPVLVGTRVRDSTRAASG
jgi:SAM-dependent methyltransferase